MIIDTPGWRIAVNASNLLDKRYVTRSESLSNRTYGAGRQIIGTITRKFRSDAGHHTPMARQAPACCPAIACDVAWRRRLCWRAAVIPSRAAA